MEAEPPPLGRFIIQKHGRHRAQAGDGAFGLLEQVRRTRLPAILALFPDELVITVENGERRVEIVTRGGYEKSFEFADFSCLLQFRSAFFEKLVVLFFLSLAFEGQIEFLYGPCDRMTQDVRGDGLPEEIVRALFQGLD